MIGIGINDNIILSKAEVNDKGTLVVSVKELGTEVKETKKASILDDMADGSDTAGNTFGEVNFLMFMPSLTKYDKDEAGNEIPEDGAVIMKSFVDLKNQLSHWLKRFTTEKNIKFSPFAGVAVNMADEKDIIAKIATKAVAEKVYNNYITQFVTQITPFLNKSEKPGRLFLHRKSVESHFGVLRKKFLGDQPFFESMDLAPEVSKMYTKQTEKTTKFHDPIEIGGVKYVPNFSKYELEKFLDNPAKAEVAADAASEAAEVEIQNVDTLFAAGSSAEDAVGTFKIEE